MSRKKPKGPSPEELEAQADELLRQDRATLEDIAANVQVLLDGFAQLKLPSNDPRYLQALQDCKRERDELGAKLTQLHIVPDSGQKTWLSVGSFPHHEALDIARKLAAHFEITDIHAHEPQI